MTPDEYTKKINRSIDTDELKQYVENDNDLSYDLLINALDGLFLDDQMDQDPTLQSQTKLQIELSKIVSLVKQMYKLTAWGNVEENAEERPKLCLICHSLKCDHIKISKSKLSIEDLLENAIHQCQHEIADDWVFEEVCAKCIMNSCEQVNSTSSEDLFVLWDEVDLTQYLRWIQKIDSEASLTN